MRNLFFIVIIAINTVNVQSYCISYSKYLALSGITLGCMYSGLRYYKTIQHNVKCEKRYYPSFKKPYCGLIHLNCSCPVDHCLFNSESQWRKNLFIKLYNKSEPCLGTSSIEADLLRIMKGAFRQEKGIQETSVASIYACISEDIRDFLVKAVSRDEKSTLDCCRQFCCEKVDFSTYQDKVVYPISLLGHLCTERDTLAMIANLLKGKCSVKKIVFPDCYRNKLKYFLCALKRLYHFDFSNLIPIIGDYMIYYSMYHIIKEDKEILVDFYKRTLPLCDLRLYLKIIGGHKTNREVPTVYRDKYPEIEENIKIIFGI